MSCNAGFQNNHTIRVPMGHQQWNFLTFSWLFPDKVPIFADFMQHENMIFWPLPKFTWVTQMKILCAVLTKSWYNLQNVKYYGNTFPDSHFLLATVRLSNIMTLTVKIWNEAFILISTPFFLTFSWLFGEFQNFLTHIKIYWLFPDFLRFLLFPDFFLTCGRNPDNIPWYLVSKNEINALVQGCSNSIALAMELLQSCTKPWKRFWKVFFVLLSTQLTDEQS